MVELGRRAMAQGAERRQPAWAQRVARPQSFSRHACADRPKAARARRQRQSSADCGPPFPRNGKVLRGGRASPADRLGAMCRPPRTHNGAAVLAVREGGRAWRTTSVRALRTHEAVQSRSAGDLSGETITTHRPGPEEPQLSTPRLSANARQLLADNGAAHVRAPERLTLYAP